MFTLLRDVLEQEVNDRHRFRAAVLPVDVQVPALSAIAIKAIAHVELHDYGRRVKRPSDLSGDDYVTIWLELPSLEKNARLGFDDYGFDGFDGPDLGIEFEVSDEELGVFGTETPEGVAKGTELRRILVAAVIKALDRGELMIDERGGSEF